MNLAFRILKLIVGLVLIVIGAGLFVIFTSSVNQAQSMGGPDIQFFSDTQWCLGVLVLDFLFLSLMFGGVRLAGFGWRVFGLIMLLLGAAILSIGIRNHVDGPPVDYDSSDPNPGRMPVPPALNVVVYFWSSLCLLGGLLLITRARSKEGR